MEYSSFSSSLSQASSTMYALYLLCFLLVSAYGKPWQQDEGNNPLFDGNSDTAPEGEQSALVPNVPAPGQEFGAGPGEGGLDDGSLQGGAQADAGPGLPQHPSGNDDDDKGDAPPFNLGVRRGGASYNVFFPIQFRTSRSHHRSVDDDGTDSGSYNAIANSFATGRKGIATSHATALGGNSDVAGRFHNFQQKPDQQAEARR